MRSFKLTFTKTITAATVTNHFMNYWSWNSSTAIALSYQTTPFLTRMQCSLTQLALSTSVGLNREEVKELPPMSCEPFTSLSRIPSAVIGYIEFAEATATESALALHNTPVLGRAIWVRRSKPSRNSGTYAKRQRKATRKKHTTGHKPRLDLNIGTGVAEGGSAEKSRDGDTQMTDATSAEDVTTGDTEEKSKTQHDFRALLL